MNNVNINKNRNLYNYGVSERSYSKRESSLKIKSAHKPHFNNGSNI